MFTSLLKIGHKKSTPDDFEFTGFDCSLLSSALRSTTVPTKDQNDTVVPAKSDSDVMFCLKSCQGLRINRSLEY